MLGGSHGAVLTALDSLLSLNLLILCASACVVVNGFYSGRFPERNDVCQRARPGLAANHPVGRFGCSRKA